MTRNFRKGFTLLELIVVIVVLGILAAIAIPTFAGVVSRAGKSSAMVTAQYFVSDVKAIYEQDNAGLVPVAGVTDLSAAEVGAALDTPLAVFNGSGYTFTLNGKTVTVSSTGVIS